MGIKENFYVKYSIFLVITIGKDFLWVYRKFMMENTQNHLRFPLKSYEKEAVWVYAKNFPRNTREMPNLWVYGGNYFLYTQIDLFMGK